MLKIHRAHAGPHEFGLLGAYRIAAVTGNIAATLAANSTLFSARWGHALHFCLLDFIEVSSFVTAAITAGVLFDWQLDIARGFTASDAAGTALDLSGDNQQLRTLYGPSLFTDMRIAAAATLTPGVRTPDARPVGRLQGFTGTAINTQFFGQNAGNKVLYQREDTEEEPVLLGQNEGLLIRNPLAGPATGTFNLLVRIGWREVLAY